VEQECRRWNTTLHLICVHWLGNPISLCYRRKFNALHISQCYTLNTAI